MRYSSLLLVYFALGAFGFTSNVHASKAMPFIIGGQDVASDDPIAATTVALLVDRGASGQFLCTGSIIDEDLVVTAGHCLGDDGHAKLTVVFDTHVSGSTLNVAATGTARPDAYVQDSNTQGNMYDIALVHFSGGLPEGFHAAQLLGDSNELSDGQEVVLAGYGVNLVPASPSSDRGSGTLRKITVNIEKAHTKSTEVLVDERHGKASCRGDSGGPAFVVQDGVYRLFGVTSRGDLECSKLALYTNILTHKAWIQQASALLR